METRVSLSSHRLSLSLSRVRPSLSLSLGMVDRAGYGPGRLWTAPVMDRAGYGHPQYDL